jgi:hypothetical protein
MKTGRTRYSVCQSSMICRDKVRLGIARSVYRKEVTLDSDRGTIGATMMRCTSPLAPAPNDQRVERWSRVTRRVLNASCLKPASENDNGSSLSPSVRRREKCRVFALWPHVVCYPVPERQFSCRLCYEHSCRLNLNTGFHASPNSNARSIQRRSNHSRRTTRNHRISIPQVQITYRPLSGDWYVVYNLVGHGSRS